MQPSETYRSTDANGVVWSVTFSDDPDQDYMTLSRSAGDQSEAVRVTDPPSTLTRQTFHRWLSDSGVPTSSAWALVSLVRITGRSHFAD